MLNLKIAISRVTTHDSDPYPYPNNNGNPATCVFVFASRSQKLNTMSNPIAQCPAARLLSVSVHCRAVVVSILNAWNKTVQNKEPETCEVFVTSSMWSIGEPATSKFGWFVDLHGASSFLVMAVCWNSQIGTRPWQPCACVVCFGYSVFFSNHPNILPVACTCNFIFCRETAPHCLQQILQRIKDLIYVRSLGTGSPWCGHEEAFCRKHPTGWTLNIGNILEVWAHAFSGWSGGCNTKGYGYRMLQAIGWWFQQCTGPLGSKAPAAIFWPGMSETNEAKLTPAPK